MQNTTSGSRSWTNFDSAAIAQILVFTVFLVVAVHLCVKHGFTLDHGWIYLLLLSLARLISSSFRLATITHPSNQNLTIGIETLESVGLGMLILVMLGLVARIFESINRQGNVFVKPIYQRIIDTLMFVSMILSIAGGTNTDRDGDDIDYSTASNVSMGLMIAVVVFLCYEVYFLLPHVGSVAVGERRIFAAVLISLPAIVVRLAYSCVLTFDDRKETFGLYLGASLIQEMLVVLVCEIFGLILVKAPPPLKHEEHQELESQSSGRSEA